MTDVSAPPSIRPPGSDGDAAPIVRVKARRRVPWGQWLAAAVLLAIMAFIVQLFATSRTLRWDAVGKFLFDPQIILGVQTTLQLTVISQIVAIVLGFGLALLQQSSNPVAVTFANAYVWYFRAVPLVVQLLFFYNIALLVPQVGLSIPFTDISWQAKTNDLISPFTAAILGLGLHEAAYMTEIIRGGMLAVPRGQRDAGLSIGLEPSQVMRRIVLPQTLRVIIPPTGNQFIGLLKASALVSVIGGGDLLTRAEFIYGRNFLIIPLLIVASAWYLALVTVFSALQYLLEVRLDPDRRPGAGAVARRIGRNSMLRGKEPL